MNAIEIIVRGILIKDNHLLVCQGIGKDYFYLPGGHIEFFETEKEALHREWEEELGCDCQIDKFLSHFEDFFMDDRQRKHHEYTFLYAVSCEALSLEKPLPQCEPHIKFHWIPLNQLPTCLLLGEKIKSFLLQNLCNKDSNS